MDCRFPSRSLLRLLARYPHRPKPRPCRACLAHHQQQTHSPFSRRTIFGGVFDRYLYPKTEEDAKTKQPWRKRDQFLPQETLARYKKTFPVVTAESLRLRMGRPRKVQMLMRDFIDDSLYNPHYGYFPKEAVIFSPPKPIDFPSLYDEAEFDAEVKRLYNEFEDQLDSKSRPGSSNDLRQVWHTPTEVFQPHYAESLARYMAANYKVSLYPYYDLLIYEMGAGNGTLMMNVLDYLRDTSPEIYERTKYKIIEISSNLAGVQASKVRQMAEEGGHEDKVEIINKSIFDWDTYVASPCFFLALEVFDNFSHDCLRYDSLTGEALQCTVFIDGANDMYEGYSKQLDPVALRFLQIRDMVASQLYKLPSAKAQGLHWTSDTGEQVRLTVPEWIPTRLMQFFDILHDYFPGHRLISSDFNVLPTGVTGVEAPVVQTRYQREMVQVSTPLVYQGHFDIMFPTNFNVMEAMYRAITGKLTRKMNQVEFLKAWAYLEETETRSGDNPLLSYYQNATVMVTV